MKRKTAKTRVKIELVSNEQTPVQLTTNAHNSQFPTNTKEDWKQYSTKWIQNYNLPIQVTGKLVDIVIKLTQIKETRE